MTNNRFKFRAWQKWVYYKYINNGVMVHFTIDDIKIMEDFTTNVIIMQYTGFEDKNGLEVFESDIVRVDNKNYEVIWDGFMWNLNDFYCGDFDYPTIAFKECSCEVVGNKYENPELLEG